MISVIIPVYNVCSYLNRCVDSILEQDYHDIEILLIDDGSTDGSGERCDGYRDEPSVRVFHQEHQGVSAARNTGIEHASGDYLWFADADDWLEPDCLQYIAQNIENADMAMFGIFNAIAQPDESFIKTRRIGWPELTTPVSATDRQIVYANVGIHNKIIRRACIGEKRFSTDLRYGEDAEFYHRIVGGIKTARIIPVQAYNYYKNRKGNVVSSGLNDRINDLLRSAILSYDSLKAIGWQDAGFHRIQIVSEEVLAKVRTCDDVKRFREYGAAFRKAMRHPDLRDHIEHVFRQEQGLKARVLYMSMLFNPYHTDLRRYLRTRHISRKTNRC